MFANDKVSASESWPALFMFALASLGMGLEGVSLDIEAEPADLN